jgi:hypothetical protein
MSKKNQKNLTKTSKVFGNDRVFKAPIDNVNGNEIIITLPKKVLEYLGADGKELFWSPVNGVIQISGKKPHMVIPIMGSADGEFLPQGKQPMIEAIV